MKMYNVLGDGTLEEVTPRKDQLRADRVLLIVDDDSQKIFVWKGKKAEVRKKFIAARQASNLRMTRGLSYRVVSLDEGEEDSTFQKILNLPTPKEKLKSKQVAKKEAVTSPTPTAEQVSSAIKTSETLAVSQKHSKISTATVTQRTAPFVDHRKLAEAELGVVSQQRAAATSTPTQQSLVETATLEIEKLPVPPGMKREMVIIGDRIYTISEKKTMFFGEVKIERTLELIQKPPEGEFFAEEYVPRIIIKNGKVLLIDFLKPESPEMIAEQIKPEAKQHLSDLIKFFEEIKSKKH
ncbi:MAG: hypothetical protein ACP6IU_04575 [Candidatus Asgardarchaeia archaeon]